MIRKILFFLVLAPLAIDCYGQSLTQTVKGRVLDSDSKSPLVGVQVVIVDSSPLKGSTTDAHGNFRIEKVNIGRVTLRFSYLGYESVTIPDIEIFSGKEAVVDVTMLESITEMDEVIITPTNDGDPLNDMAIVSTRSISANETNRYAGGFNDPARILSNFAGVNNSQDGSADIIVRGNSPKYLQWRLEGIQMTNPNHFADPSGLGTNGTSALNNNVLATSDFYTGAFPAEYGDAISGVYDVKLRTGNREKFEGILGVGVLGTDLTFEGPFNKNYSGSFLANYRFTTVGLVSEIGLLDQLPGVPHFQDGVFKIVLPTKKVGIFSLFGLTGASSIRFEDVDPFIWVTPNDRGRREDIIEDFEKEATLINSGVNHHLPINENSYLLTQIAYSGEKIHDRVIETLTENSVVRHKMDNFNSQVEKSAYRGNITFYNKLSARSSVQIGSRYSIRRQKFNATQLMDDEGTQFQLASFDKNISSLSAFLSWKYRILSNMTIVSGLHNTNVFLNNESTVEPRIAAQWQFTRASSFRIGYGMHSTMEAVHNYFSRVQMPDGRITEPNHDLKLLKAHHFIVGYEMAFQQDLRMKIEAYHQQLYDLPVANSADNPYCTINETIDIQFVDLVNQGTGNNSGIELTVEKYFSNHFYYLVNASLFESTYKAIDGVKRNTAFNNNYLVNILFGREFSKLGRKQNQTFSVNVKAFLGGGKRIVPLLRDSDGNLAVDPANNQYYDIKRAYSSSLDDIYTVTLSFSYKWNKQTATHEVFLNVDNISDNKPRLGEYYAPEKPGSIGYQTSIGIFPNLMYRLYF